MTTSTVASITNPYDGSVIAELPLTDEWGVAAALAIAEEGYAINRAWPRWRRAEVLERTAHAIARDANAWAELIARESGLPIKQTRKEVHRATITFHACADEARRLRGDVVPFDGYRGYDGWSGHFERVPIGIVVGITPYNGPLNLVAHKVGPAIAAGNSIIIKPSEHTPLSALRLRETMIECGMPSQFMSVVLGTREANRALVSDRRVRMISFTGGNTAAESVVRDAGVKRYMMELGGNAPVIVLADADLDHAVEACVSGAFWAAGQNCIGVQRIFVEAAVAETFRERFVTRVDRLRLGDPLDDSTDIGPLISDAHAGAVERIVADAIRSGARCLSGNVRKGRLYSPTVLADTPRRSSAWCQEIFGPVVNIEPFDTLEDAVKLANTADALIHAGIFTNDVKRARYAMDGLEASGVILNESSDFRFDGMPFGGSKYGNVAREGVPFTIQEMSQPKVMIRAPDRR